MQQQEYFIQIQMLSQEAEKIEEQLQLIEQQFNELQEIRKSVDGIDKASDNQEILANLGKGIFVRAEVKSKELMINIGKETVIKKSPAETIAIIDKQLEHLTLGKEQLVSRIQEIQVDVQELLSKARANDSKEGHTHKHQHEEGEDCDCENGKCEDDECSCGHKH